MPIYRAQITYPMDSGLPEDAATNTLYFVGDGVDESGDLDGIESSLTTFLQAIDVYLSQRLANVANVRYYNMSDPSPRVPIREDAITLTPGTGNTMVAEVALCLSFQGQKASGVDQAHRRGRIYLGPLDAGAAGGTATTSDRPLTTCVTAVATAASNLKTNALAAGVPWAVFSPTLGLATHVVDGWVDNAFDTQRRRGLRPTTRTTFS